MSNHIKKRDFRRGGSRSFKLPRFRKKRLKSFKTKEAAEKWAKDQGIKNPVIVDMHPYSNTNNKFKVMEQ